MAVLDAHLLTKRPLDRRPVRLGRAATLGCTQTLVWKETVTSKLWLLVIVTLMLGLVGFVVLNKTQRGQLSGHGYY